MRLVKRCSGQGGPVVSLSLLLKSACGIETAGDPKEEMRGVQDSQHYYDGALKQQRVESV